MIGAIGFVLYQDTHEWQKINTHIKALLSELDFYRRALDKEQSGAHYHINDLIGRSALIKAVNDKIYKVAVWRVRCVGQQCWLSTRSPD